MGEEFIENSEDILADTDFEDDEEKELKDTKFISFEPKKVEIKDKPEEKLSQFFGEGDKLLAEKIIHKKSGAIIEIKYNLIGNKESVTERDKNKKLIKATDYHPNGIPRLVTEYGQDGVSYKSMAYNADGTRQSYVEKHPDGTADATYYNADNTGARLVVKMNANKEVIEKRIER